MMDLSGLLKLTVLGVKEKIMALFKITTLVQFKHDYFVEADCLEHAYDEVTMRESGADEDYFDEASQTYLGETIMNGEASSHGKFEDFLEEARDDEDRMQCSHWMGVDLIRTVKYDDPTLDDTTIDQPHDTVSVGREVFKQMGTSLILGTPSIGPAGPKEESFYGLRWGFQ